MSATLYTLLTGQPIFDFRGCPTNKALHMILSEPPVPIRDRRPEVPQRLADAIHTGLAKKPSNRHPDAAAMRAKIAG